VSESFSSVILMQNDLCHELPVRVKAADKVIAATLQALVINSSDLIAGHGAAIG
jgi:hypothetical protein